MGAHKKTQRYLLPFSVAWKTTLSESDRLECMEMQTYMHAIDDIRARIKERDWPSGSDEQFRRILQIVRNRVVHGEVRLRGDDQQQRTRLPVLEGFCRLVRGPAREDVELVITDLKKDVRQMERDGCGAWHIRAVVIWATANTIVPILWSGVQRWVERIVLVADWIRKFTGH